MMRVTRLVSLVAAGFLTAGCAGLFPSGPSPVESRFQAGTRALESGEWEQAREALAEVASRCESGERGRGAILLLSTLELDARNPDADPARAASFAVRYLMLPDAPNEGHAIARTLYVLAIDQGAPADLDAELGTAPRFSDCEQPVDSVDRSALPVHPGTPAALVLDSLRAERDAHQSRAAALADTLQTVRSRVVELEAEIERIRDLLKAGGGTVSSRDR
ncbi:MAG: hypothetical protein RQ745_06485 [Longimicrobiales bacterium]|nr:hypothetical protein [Longimicrobiales bacterium]